MSVGWFAEQDEEERDMENTNHFLIFHPEVGWGMRVEPKLTRVCAAPAGLVPPGFVDSGGGSEGWHREKCGCVMHQGLKTICPKAAFPRAAHGDKWCGAPRFPRRGSPALHQTLDCRRGDNEFKGTSFFIEGNPEHWKFTLKSRPPGHEFQE